MTRADFVFMGADTERNQKADLVDILRYRESLQYAVAQGISMLFAGTAMELLGKTIVDAQGNAYAALGLGDFVSTQGTKRIVGDVYGHSSLCSAPVVGYMTKCIILPHVEQPL